MKLSKQDIHIHQFLGAWMCSAMVGTGIYARRVQAQYYGYTKTQAIRLFIEEYDENN